MNLGQAGLRVFVKKCETIKQKIVDLQRNIMSLKELAETDQTEYYTHEISTKEKEVASLKEKLAVLEGECKAIKADIEARIERGKRKIKLEMDEFKAAEEYIKTLNI